MITFNGHDLSSLIKILDVKGRGVLKQDVTSLSVATRHGSYFQRRKLLERVISVDFMIKGDTDTQLREGMDILNQILNVEQPGTIVFSDEPTKTYHGILTGSSDLDEVRSIGKGSMEFTCHDPFKYGTEKAFTFSVGDTHTINVGGTVETPMIFDVEFYGAESYLEVSNQEGKFVKVHRSFVAGSDLHIDFGKRLVVIDGITSMPSLDLGSHFFALKPGANTLKIIPQGSTKGTIKYTERWI